jgi:hypothetical protein
MRFRRDCWTETSWPLCEVETAGDGVGFVQAKLCAGDADLSAKLRLTLLSKIKPFQNFPIPRLQAAQHPDNSVDALALRRASFRQLSRPGTGSYPSPT